MEAVPVVEVSELTLPGLQAWMDAMPSWHQVTEAAGVSRNAQQNISSASKSQHNPSHLHSSVPVHACITHETSLANH